MASTAKNNLILSLSKDEAAPPAADKNSCNGHPRGCGQFIRARSQHPVPELGKHRVTPDLALADDRLRPFRIGALELAGDAVAVEDGVGEIARRQAIAGAT